VTFFEAVYCACTHPLCTLIRSAARESSRLHCLEATCTCPGAGPGFGSGFRCPCGMKIPSDPAELCGVRLAAAGVLVLGFGLFSLAGAGLDEETPPSLRRDGGGIANQPESPGGAHQSPSARLPPFAAPCYY
jgi:hypothetical protein